MAVTSALQSDGDIAAGTAAHKSVTASSIPPHDSVTDSLEFAVARVDAVANLPDGCKPSAGSVPGVGSAREASALPATFVAMVVVPHEIEEDAWRSL